MWPRRYTQPLNLARKNEGRDEGRKEGADAEGGKSPAAPLVPAAGRDCGRMRARPLLLLLPRGQVCPNAKTDTPKILLPKLIL